MSETIPKLALSQHLRSLLDGRRVVAGVFTAYTFEPQFFEQEVMTLLAGDELHQEPKLRLLQLQELLRAEIGPIAVYYDQGGLKADGPAKLDVRYIPLRVKTGVFHPKLILLLTTPTSPESAARSRLIVGVLSANLTRNGWWESLECAHFEAVDEGETFAFRRDLRETLRTVRGLSGRPFGHESVDMIDKWLDSNTNQSSHATIERRLRTRLLAGNQPFIDFLVEHGPDQLYGASLEVISPFFDDEDAAPLRDLIEALNIREARVFLPTADDGSAICSKKLYESVQAMPRASWATLPDDLLRLGKDAKARRRGVHAKVYRFIRRADRYECLVVGSHNLTTPAHQKGGNFEASFILERKAAGPIDWWMGPRTRKPSTFKPELRPTDDDSTSQTVIPLQVCFNWKEEFAEARWDGESSSPHLTVAASGATLFEVGGLQRDTWSALSSQAAAALKQTLPGTSLLTVSRPDGATDLLLVQESEMSRKPSIVVTFSASDILAYWARLTPADRADYLAAHFEGNVPDDWSAGGIVEKAVPAPVGFFETFAGIFHGFEMLRLQVADCIEQGNEKKADYLLFGSRHDSLPHLIDKMASPEEQQDALAGYLVLLCARQLLEEMRRSGESFYADRRKEIIVLLARTEQASAFAAKLDLGAEGAAFTEWFEKHFLKRARAATPEAVGG